MLLQVKAKVKLYSETDLEIEDLDLGTIVSRSSQWGWRKLGLLEDEVYKIMAFSSTKCLIQMYDKELILVNEPFEKVYNKWLEAKKLAREPAEEPEFEDSNEENENFEEDSE
jgi:hypothetical protein